MGKYTIKKGLDLPITGSPEPVIDANKVVKQVAILAQDYIGMRPTFKVAVGDKVKRGQTIFENKKLPGVLHTSFACGEVKAKGNRLTIYQKMKFVDYLLNRGCGYHFEHAHSVKILP